MAPYRTKVPQKLAICHLCGKDFSDTSSLNRHLALHANRKPFACKWCGYRFSQKAGLKSHVNIHTGARPFACNIGMCTMRFGDQSSASRHRKTVHGDVVYFCRECKNSDGTILTLARKDSFRKHMEKRHNISVDALQAEDYKCEKPAKYLTGQRKQRSQSPRSTKDAFPPAVRATTTDIPIAPIRRSDRLATRAPVSYHLSPSPDPFSDTDCSSGLSSPYQGSDRSLSLTPAIPESHESPLSSASSWTSSLGLSGVFGDVSDISTTFQLYPEQSATTSDAMYQYGNMFSDAMYYPSFQSSPLMNAPSYAPEQYAPPPPSVWPAQPPEVSGVPHVDDQGMSGLPSFF
ncbi:hypothetical protein K474DRAFT_1702889 [Panus rudis PR-1116 ss-1]|nr:hypothetical protein K474DRAFT_1702889 [Panus rudis PR-1116 ss-1]